MKARFTGRVWKEVLCAVLKVCQIFVYFKIGDWSNGMTGVSKTLSGSSILSSPGIIKPEKAFKINVFSWLFLRESKGNHLGNQNECLAIKYKRRES